MRTALLAALLLAIGCASAYDETYAQQTEKLERQEQARQVQGFADSTETESLDQELSEQRAASVARYLSSEGVVPSRIRTEGFASEFAARPNVTAQGRQRNRRVEVTVR